MVIVSVISQKGGAGKTTLAIHLGAAAHEAGFPSVVIDTDPQATACRWGKWRGGLDPDILDCASHGVLPDKLATLDQAGARFAVIDTPPHADIMARTACRVADLILIPCRPRAFDLDAIRATAELAQASGKPAFVVFTAGPVRAALLYAEAAKIIQDIGLPIAPVMLPDRAAFHHSVGEGKTVAEFEPHGKAAGDVAALWKWTCIQVNLKTGKRVYTKVGAA